MHTGYKETQRLGDAMAPKDTKSDQILGESESAIPLPFVGLLNECRETLDNENNNSWEKS